MTENAKPFFSRLSKDPVNENFAAATNDGFLCLM